MVGLVPVCFVGCHSVRSPCVGSARPRGCLLVPREVHDTDRCPRCGLPIVRVPHLGQDEESDRRAVRVLARLCDPAMIPAPGHVAAVLKVLFQSRWGTTVSLR